MVRASMHRYRGASDKHTPWPHEAITRMNRKTLKHHSIESMVLWIYEARIRSNKSAIETRNNWSINRWSESMDQCIDASMTSKLGKISHSNFEFMEQWLQNDQHVRVQHHINGSMCQLHMKQWMQADAPMTQHIHEFKNQNHEPMNHRLFPQQWLHQLGDLIWWRSRRRAQIPSDSPTNFKPLVAGARWPGGPVAWWPSGPMARWPVLFGRSVVKHRINESESVDRWIIKRLVRLHNQWIRIDASMGQRIKSAEHRTNGRINESNRAWLNISMHQGNNSSVRQWDNDNNSMKRGKVTRINQPMSQTQCVDDTEATSQWWVNGSWINESMNHSHDQSRSNKNAIQKVSGQWRKELKASKSIGNCISEASQRIND